MVELKWRTKLGSFSEALHNTSVKVAVVVDLISRFLMEQGSPAASRPLTNLLLWDLVPTSLTVSCPRTRLASLDNRRYFHGIKPKLLLSIICVPFCACRAVSVLNAAEQNLVWPTRNPI